jgi:hypothetical protein
MTPVRANLDNKTANESAADSRSRRLNLVGAAAAEKRSDELSVFKTPSAGILSSPAAIRLAGSVVGGTVGAAVAPVEEDSYSFGSFALLSGQLLGHKPSLPARTRANDLVAELREISGQVNRMMSQVDRAIHRLGEHAGEPVRR